MKIDDFRDKHLIVWICVLGILLTTTLLNILVDENMKSRNLIVVPRITRPNLINFFRVPKTLDFNVTDFTTKEPDIWQQNRHKNEHVVLEETIERKNVDISISIVDELEPKNDDPIKERFKQRSLETGLTFIHSE